jgi:hypothetical protein
MMDRKIPGHGLCPVLYRHALAPLAMPDDFGVLEIRCGIGAPARADRQLGRGSISRSAVFQACASGHAFGPAAKRAIRGIEAPQLQPKAFDTKQKKWLLQHRSKSPSILTG